MAALCFVKRVDNKLAWDLVKKADLPFNVVRALLLRGWTYEEPVTGVDIWVSPVRKT